MFYTSHRFRESNKLLIPKGPRLRRKPITVNICGATLSFKSPKTDKTPRNIPESSYDLKGLGFNEGYFDRLSEEERKNKCGFKNIYKQFFKFNGPWFTGSLATLIFRATVIKLEHYPESISAFHPRSLEKIIDDYLTHRFGKTCEYNGHIQEYNAPLNWRPLDYLPVNAVHFSVQRSLTNRPDGELWQFVFVPIAHRLVILFNFYEGRSGILPTCALDKLTSREPIQALIDNIISSIDIQLSPEAKVQQERALEGLEDTSLVTDYPPIKWDNLDDETRAQILEQDERDRIAEYGC